jgi:hypothetical protein
VVAPILRLCGETAGSSCACSRVATLRKTRPVRVIVFMRHADLDNFMLVGFGNTATAEEMFMPGFGPFADAWLGEYHLRDAAGESAGQKAGTVIR